MDKDIFREREHAFEEEYFRKKNQELIDKMRQRLAQEGGTTATANNCPKCNGKLHTGNFENIQIDVCDNCGGVWLDAGEFQKLTHHEESGFFGRLFG